MTFADTLKNYIEELNCNAKTLADASGVSAANISRYLSSERIPAADGPVPQQLAEGIVQIAEQAGRADLNQDVVAKELISALTGIEADYETFAQHFRLLIESLGINGNRLARALGFDPSYISRIQSGQRRPANVPHFIDGVSNYVARNCSSEDYPRIATVCNIDATSLTGEAAVAQAVRSYLGSDAPAATKQTEVEHLLKYLDEFNLNDYLESVHFDDIKVPTAPFQLPTTKTYRGIEEMKQAELDFLRAAVLSKSKEDVILYSDMPMEEMAEDKEFPKKVMVGMAMLVKKGVHLVNIHDVHRPINELIMGLEGWFPVYMTGQISPYYLEFPTNRTFLHFLRSAGTVAVAGEAIAGNQAGGRYVVTKNPTDVAYYRQRAKELVAHAKPLLRFYFEGDEDKLAVAVETHRAHTDEEPYAVGEGIFKNMTLTVLPGQYALVAKERAPKIYMLVEHPALVNAFSQYSPMLY